MLNQTKSNMLMNLISFLILHREHVANNNNKIKLYIPKGKLLGRNNREERMPEPHKHWQNCVSSEPPSVDDILTHKVGRICRPGHGQIHNKNFLRHPCIILTCMLPCCCVVVARTGPYSVYTYAHTPTLLYCTVNTAYKPHMGRVKDYTC